METEDPRAALDDKSVAVRAAAARDLQRWGTWDDVEALVERGWRDKSMPVRLYMAAAAADIVCRRKGAWGQDALSPDEQAQVLRWAFGGDPGVNPSMLMLAGAVETPAALERLARMIRDPRSDVRLGVVTAVRRMVLSAASDRDLVAEHVGRWLSDERLPDDTRVELVKIIGEAGLARLRPSVLSVRLRGGAVAEVADEALDRLALRDRPEAWSGVWHSDGLDVFELSVQTRADDVAVSDPARWYEPGRTLDMVREDGVTTIGGQRASLVWATPLGTHEPAMALQHGGRTWWAVSAATAADFLEARWRVLQRMDADAARALRDWVDRQEGAAAQRAGVIAAWMVGDLDQALERLEPMMRRKKPRNDLFWWRGRVLADLGRKAEATEDLEAFLDKLKPDTPLFDEATALLAELRG